MKLLVALAAVVALAVVPLTAARADTATQPTDATLTWTMNGEVQGRPFFGNVNYLSAGISDGTQATYAATDQDVTILQRGATGLTAPATWETRAAHVGGTGSAAQLVSLAGGDVSVAADGATDIRWTGAWTVNMYGGLAPYTLANPHLVVDATGTGTLRADLSGYAGVIGSSAPATPVAPVADVVVATFSGVTVDTTTGFIVTPHFGGVAVTVPAGTTAQSTAVAGWGAWPQQFVDFHQETGLASYFFTSNTPSTDPLKAPAAISVGFGGAAPPVPVVIPTPTATTTATTTPKPSVAVAKPTVAGTLLWGVKSSFRSYITGSIAQGSITVSKGATTSRGVVAFSQDSGGTFTAAKKKGTSRYSGSVRFYGHEGILDITMSDPVVTIVSSKKATLSVVVGGHRVTLGTVALTDSARSEHKGAISYTGAPVTLTAAGSAVFSYGGTTFYPAGTAMDPVTFTIGKRSTSKPAASTLGAYVTWKAPATAPATSGATLQGTASAGGQITVTASGFAKNETGIRVVLYSSPVVLAEKLTADAAGTVTAQVTLPAALAGEHVLTVQGSVDRGARFTVQAAAAIEGCTVQGAELTWGFKESFRSYISGTIANGQWTTSGNASYATPSFTFAKGAGVADVEANTAVVSFTGGIRFTGHDGALDLTVSNPVYRQLDATTAELLVDMTSKPLDGGATIDEKSVRFVTLELSSDGPSAAAAPATLTSEGAAAFAGFYKAGAEFDPIDLVVTLPPSCAAASASTSTPTSTPGTTPSSTPDAGVRADATSDSSFDPAVSPWLIALVVALLLALVAAGIVIGRQRRALDRAHGRTGK